MVKDLSFPDRLRISGNTVFKEIGTREKKLKRRGVSFDSHERDTVFL